MSKPRRWARDRSGASLSSVMELTGVVRMIDLSCFWIGSWFVTEYPFLTEKILDSLPMVVGGVKDPTTLPPITFPPPMLTPT